MPKQGTFADSGFEKYRRKTRRERFLEEMEKAVPWQALLAVIEPQYPKEPGQRGGRPPRGLEVMLRIHLLQHWFKLSDPGVEDALYESAILRRFVGIDLAGPRPPPDLPPDVAEDGLPRARIDLYPSDFTPPERVDESPVEDDPFLDPQHVVDLVKEMVDAAWETEGWSLRATKQFLMVRAPRSVQRQVAVAVARMSALK